MRKLKLEIQMSMDGFIARPNGDTDWMIWNWGPEWNWDPELQKYHTELTKSADCIFISRQMAEEGFIAHWKSMTKNQKDPQFEFATHVTATSKIVFTNTLNKSTPIPGGWHSVDIADSDYVGFVNKLKQQEGKDILVYGGASLVTSLIEAQLIDEFHLLINPVEIGKGLTIFNAATKTQNRNLVISKSFECGMTLLHYDRKTNHII